MHVYIFRSSTQPNLFGFTEHQAGDNLPAQFGPWHQASGGLAMEVYPEREPQARMIVETGFFLADVSDLPFGVRLKP
jgi:hypothetical protein